MKSADSGVRKHDIDNLRWMILFILIPYHTAMAWNVWGEPYYVAFEGNRLISSIIALSVSAAIATWQGVTHFDIGGNLPSTVFGIGLILASLVFRYGAELESRNQSENTSKEMLNEEES